MATVIDRLKLPDSTQLDTLNGKLDTINTTLAGQEFVTKDNIVSALGYEPEKPKGFELVEAIDITTDTWEFVRTQAPDGTAYAFKAVRVEIAFPTNASSTNIIVDYKTQDTHTIRSYILDAYRSSSVTYAVNETNGQTGRYTSQWTGAVGDYGSYKENYYNAAAVYGIEATNNPIVRLRFACSSVAFLSGTTIKIYGIRA